jgi:glycosyltransferase involved in cell wall biosynthesis
VAVVFVGRLDHQKGIDTLLDGLALAQGSLAGVRVVLVGDGPARGALQFKAASLGLAGMVSFLGERSDVPAILGSGDLFVLPSRFEALSLSLLEALAAGLPVIVSMVGDHPRLVDSLGAGLVVPVDDAPALGAALTAMARDLEFRAECGKRAATLGAPFSLDEFWRRHDDLYRTVGSRES